MLRRLSDWTNSNSLANQMRTRRMEVFGRLIEPLTRPLRVVDVGGTIEYWEQRGWSNRNDLDVTVVNLDRQNSRYSNITSITGDARNLSCIADQSFDIAFSNSVIEHVGPFDQKSKMAREIHRIARAHWVQTPNYWFPIEPHFLFPGWQWLPEALRVAMLRRRGFGWNGRCPDADKALAVVRDAQLLTYRDLRKLFPASMIIAERFVGLAKSWIVIGGFPKHSVESAAGHSL